MQSKVVFTQGAPWKAVIRFSLPVFGGLLLQQLYNTIDTLIVGNFLGEAALSAVGTTGSLTAFFLALATGFSAGAGVLVAKHLGANEPALLRRKAIAGIALLMGMGLMSMVVGIALCRPVLRMLLKSSPHLLDMAAIYFSVYALGFVFQFGYNILAAVLRAVGDSKASMYFLLIASSANIVLDIAFIALLGWGVAGAAVATVLSQAGSFAAAAAYMYRHYDIFHIQKKEWRLHAGEAMELLKSGFPMALQQVVVSLGFLFVQQVVNSYGQSMIASYTVGQRIETYMSMPAIAFQTTLVTFTSQNTGAGRMDRAVKGARQTLLLSFMVTACMSTVIFFAADTLISWFSLSAQAALFCRAHLRVTAVLLLILALYFPMFGFFQGVGDGFAATRAVTCALFTRAFTAHMLCHIPLFGHRIVWWNALFGFSVGFFMTWIHYWGGKWKIKAISRKGA